MARVQRLRPDDVLGQQRRAGRHNRRCDGERGGGGSRGHGGREGGRNPADNQHGGARGVGRDAENCGAGARAEGERRAGGEGGGV